MLNFDSGKLFIPDALLWAEEAQLSMSPEYLGDMIRIQTIVEKSNNALDHPFSILRRFNLDSDPKSVGEMVWEIVEDIRMQVFSEMIALTGSEFRLDWSREDGAFCLWHRDREKNMDVTRDIEFVRRNTLPFIRSCEIRNSQVHGFGLFASEPIESGDEVGSLDGQKISFSDYENLQIRLSHSLGNLRNHFFMEWNAMPSGDLLARSLRTNYSYINHSCSPNLVLVHGSKTVLVRALRNIKIGEELFLDYRKENLPRNYFTAIGSSYLREPDKRND